MLIGEHVHTLALALPCGPHIQILADTTYEKTSVYSASYRESCAIVETYMNIVLSGEMSSLADARPQRALLFGDRYVPGARNNT